MSLTAFPGLQGTDVTNDAGLGTGGMRQVHGYQTKLALFTDDHLLRGAALTGIANGKEGALYFWVKINEGDGNIALFDADPNSVLIQRITGGALRVLLYDASAVGQGTIQTADSTLTNTTGLAAVLVSWNSTTQTRQCYINDVNALDSGSIGNDVTFGYGQGTEWALGGTTAGSQLLSADMGEFWFDTNFIDFTLEQNRRKFITRGIRPVYLGEDGSRPTGTAPYIYCRRDFEANLGSGGNFTEQSALVDGLVVG